jgi:hypothetical protein
MFLEDVHVRVDEARGPREGDDMIARQLGANHLALRGYRVLGAPGYVGDRDLEPVRYRIASRRVFDAMVPVCRHAPPTISLRSTIATFLPSFAAAIALF